MSGSAKYDAGEVHLVSSLHDQPPKRELSDLR
jgi:hypothetical protein